MQVFQEKVRDVPPLSYHMKSSEHAHHYLTLFGKRKLKRARHQIIPNYRNGVAVGHKLILNFKTPEDRAAALLFPPDQSLVRS